MDLVKQVYAGYSRVHRNLLEITEGKITQWSTYMQLEAMLLTEGPGV